MRKTSKKKAIVPSKVPVTETSEDAIDDNTAKVSEQSDEVATESVSNEAASNTRVRRGKRNAKLSDEVKGANQGKKSVACETANATESENSAKILDNETDNAEPAVVCSQQSEKAAEPNIPINDEATKPRQIDDEKDVYAVSEPSSGDSTETLGDVADKHNASTDSPEEVSNITATVVTAENSSNCDEVVSKCTKRENVDVESSSNDILETTGNSEDVENKRQKLDLTDTSKADGGSTDAPQTDESLSRKVFVGGLPHTITEDKLKEYFENFGRVLDIDLIRDRHTNRIRGFAFLLFEKEDSANTCIQLKTHEICQKICDVRKVHKNRLSHNNKHVVNRHSTGFNRYSNSRLNQQQNIKGTSNIGANFQRMFQQALMGQQRNAYRPPVPPPSRFLINRPPIVNTPFINPLASTVQRNNVFVQALLNRQIARPAIVRPMVALPSRPVIPMTTPFLHRPPGNIAALNQLAHRMKAYTNITNKRPPTGAKHLYKPY